MKEININTINLSELDDVLYEYIGECRKILINSDPQIIVNFPTEVYDENAFDEIKGWSDEIMNKVRDLNKLIIPSRRNHNPPIKNSANIYAIKIKINEVKGWRTVYIGESTQVHVRLRQHLVQFCGRSRSKLYDVNNILSKHKGQIGLSFINIQPPYFRKAVEERMIRENSSTLIWNKIDKN